MKLIKTDWDMPYYNMALENYLLNSGIEGGFLFFYIHKPSIIVGSHQNTLQEINFPYVMKNNIAVARRVSGGGAVYHDYGNLNYSFVLDRNGEQMINFQPLTEPLIAALKALGIKAELSGRNDILVDNKKFSGTAQYIGKNKILSHGTLMFDVDIEAMVESLSVDEEKIKSKAIQSVRSRVANLKDFLKDEMTIYEFRSYITNAVLGDNYETYSLSDEACANIEESVKSKYSTWEYNFGSSPPFSLTKRKRFAAGTVEIGLNIENGHIVKCQLKGDFFPTGGFSDLEGALIGKPMKKEAIEAMPEADSAIAFFSAVDLADLIFG